MVFEVKTKPQMRSIKKDKVLCFMLNGKRDFGKEREIAKLLNDVLKSIE